MKIVKIGWKMAKLWPCEAHPWPILGRKMAILATFEIWPSNLFLIYIDGQTEFELGLQKNLAKTPKILKIFGISAIILFGA